MARHRGQHQRGKAARAIRGEDRLSRRLSSGTENGRSSSPGKMERLGDKHEAGGVEDERRRPEP
jgi:hypothetical protein